MENGFFHLPRRASELVRRTDSIILLSCNYKSKERLEPCMTEHGLGERAVVSLSFDFYPIKSVHECLRKNTSDPSDYVESL